MSIEAETQAKRDLLLETIDTMDANGWTVNRVFDSEEHMPKTDLEQALAANNRDAVVDYAMAADTGVIGFTTEDGKRCAIMMAYDNPPDEIIYDMSGSDDDALKTGEQLLAQAMNNWEDLQADSPAPGM